MACDIANGRAESCKDSVSGLLAVYLINYGITAAEVTYDATNTDLINTISGATVLYKFELKGENSFDQDIKTDRNTGTTYFEQKLNIKQLSNIICICCKGLTRGCEAHSCYTTQI